MRGVDHQLVGLAHLTDEPREDAVEDAMSAPAHEAVIECLVRTVGGGRIAPAPTIADNVNDTGDDALIIDVACPMLAGKKGATRASCARAGQNWFDMTAPPPPRYSQPAPSAILPLMGSEPRRRLRPKANGRAWNSRVGQQQR